MDSNVYQFPVLDRLRLLQILQDTSEEVKQGTIHNLLIMKSSIEAGFEIWRIDPRGLVLQDAFDFQPVEDALLTALSRVSAQRERIENATRVSFVDAWIAWREPPG